MNSGLSDDEAAEREKKEKKVKALAKVVCICKGIPLRKVLPALEGSTTVADVNAKAGTGSGGCAGQRCGPRIKMLLQQKKKLENSKTQKNKSKNS